MAAVVFVVMIIGGYLLFVRTDTAEASEVLLEPVASEGLFPWTGSLVPEGAPTSVPLPPPTGVPNTPDAGRAPLISVPGDRAGIYGGSLELSVCDKKKLVAFLLQNSSQGAAWADVLGVDDISGYIDALTSVIVSADTRVTNHGFEDGKATSLQSVLQAGTAVLIDDHGVPRVRCQCGNPLLPPVLSKTPPKYTGAPWTGFNPGQIVVVQPSATPITQITVINVTTGGPLVIPVGGPTPPTATSSPPPPTQQPSSQPPATQQPRTQPQATQQPRTPPPTQQPRTSQNPSAQDLQLTSITLTRTYGGYVDQTTYPQNAAFQPGTVTAGPSERQFQVGWDFRWPETMENRNRGVATVTLTQVPTTVTANQPSQVGAAMAGEWITTGYGVDRDHTLSLSGATGTNSQDFSGPPSGSVQGSIEASGSTPPVATGSGATLRVAAVIRFGSDHVGELLIELNYQPG